MQVQFLQILSHDHLDYHGSFEAYISAKKKLFDNLPSGSFALVNIDDKRGSNNVAEYQSEQGDLRG